MPARKNWPLPSGRGLVLRLSQCDVLPLGGVVEPHEDGGGLAALQAAFRVERPEPVRPGQNARAVEREDIIRIGIPGLLLLTVLIVPAFSSFERIWTNSALVTAAFIASADLL